METSDIAITSDDETTSDYFSISHSRQSSCVSCLDEILGELEDRRDSVLFVEEEVSECGDNDSGIFFKPSQKFQLKWKLKPKALLGNSTSGVMSSVSNKWNRSVSATVDSCILYSCGVVVFLLCF